MLWCFLGAVDSWFRAWPLAVAQCSRSMLHAPSTRKNSMNGNREQIVKSVVLPSIKLGILQ